MYRQRVLIQGHSVLGPPDPRRLATIGRPHLVLRASFTRIVQSRLQQLSCQCCSRRMQRALESSRDAPISSVPCSISTESAENVV